MFEVADQIVVCDEDVPGPGPARAGQLLEHVLDWLHAHAPTMNHDDIAEVAAMGTASRGLDGQAGIVARAHQLVARHRRLGEIDPLRLAIDTVVVTAVEVPAESRPGVLGVSDEEHVHMGCTELGPNGGVRTAHHHPAPPPPERVGQLERSWRVHIHAGEADQIAGRIEIDGLDVLVDHSDVPVVGCERSDGQERQRRVGVARGNQRHRVLEPPERWPGGGIHE